MKILIIFLISCSKFNINLEIKNKNINEKLILAIKNNDANKVLHLIENGANVNYIFNNKSALEIAIYEENLSIIKLLLQRGVYLSKEVIAKVYNLALYELDYDIIDLIKDKYKTLEDLIETKRYFLLLCYLSNSEEVKKFIEINNIDPKEVKDRIKRNGLIIASAGGKIDVVRLLIEKYNLDINSKDFYENTPLSEACNNGHKDLIKILLDKGANVNDLDIGGYSPLMVASSNNYKDIIEILLDKNANINNIAHNRSTALILAIKNGNREIVEFLLDRGSNINDKAKGNNSLLLLASEKGYEEIVKLLLNRGAAVDQKNDKEDTALIIASSKGYSSIVKLLLTENANIENKNNEKNTALMLAAANGHKEIVKLLVEKGAGIDNENIIGRNPLLSAIFNKHTEVVKILLKKKANVIFKNNYENRVSKALLLASENFQKDIVELLLKKRANINYKNDIGDNALICATKTLMFASYEVMRTLKKKRIEVMKLLLKQGININDKDNNGNTALMYATNNSYKEVVELLLNKKANIDDANMKGINPLLLAISKSDDIDMIEFLLGRGANIEHRNNRGDTALIVASSKKDNKDIVELLLNNGAIINEKNNDGNTALMFAANKGFKNIIELLLDRDANINDKNLNNHSALLIASLEGHREVVKILLNRGANINDKGPDNCSALLIASSEGHREVVELLLDRGANIEDKNFNGWSALSLAAFKGHEEIVELLLNRDANINNLTNAKNTALMLASSNNHVNIVSLILEKNNGINADINFRNSVGHTALTFSCSKGNKEVAELLINKGAKLENRVYKNLTNKGKTALTLALENNHKDIVNLLISKGAKIYSFKNNLIENILIENIKNNYLNMSLFIINKYKSKINLNFKDQEGNALIHYACLLNNLPLFTSLIFKRNINILNNQGETPLYFALLSDRINEEFILHLINEGAILKPNSYIKDRSFIDILSSYEEICNRLIYEPLIFKLLDDKEINYDQKAKIKNIIKILKLKEDDFEEEKDMTSFIRNIILNKNVEIDLRTVPLTNDINQDIELNIEVFDEIFAHFKEEDYWSSIVQKGLDIVLRNFKEKLEVIKSYKPVNKSIFQMNNNERAQNTNFQRKKKLAYLLRLISKTAKNGHNNDKIKFAINQILDIVACNEGSLEVINDAVRYLSNEENIEIKELINEELTQFRYNILKEVCINKIKINVDRREEVIEITPHVFPQLVKEMSEDLKLKTDYLDDEDYNLVYNKNEIVSLVLNRYKGKIIKYIRDKVEENRVLWNKIRDYIERDIFRGRAVLQIDNFIYGENYKIKKEVVKALLIHWQFLK